MTKNCDGCIACCNGTLVANIHGEEVNRSHPCSHICYEHMNCSQYHNRPPVCSTFKCLWLTQDDMPEWLKPSESGVLLLHRKGYVEVHSVNGMKFTADVFVIAMNFASINRWPIKFFIDASSTPYGDFLGGIISHAQVKIGIKNYE